MRCVKRASANPLAARVSGINVERHIVPVYTIDGLSSGLCGVLRTARAISGQASVGGGFELEAVVAAVTGGTSLDGGVGRMTGTVIGAVILGALTSGFTFSTSMRIIRRSSKAASSLRLSLRTSTGNANGAASDDASRRAWRRRGDYTFSLMQSSAGR